MAEKMRKLKSKGRKKNTTTTMRHKRVPATLVPQLKHRSFKLGDMTAMSPANCFWYIVIEIILYILEIYIFDMPYDDKEEEYIMTSRLEALLLFALVSFGIGFFALAFYALAQDPMFCNMF